MPEKHITSAVFINGLISGKTLKLYWLLLSIFKPA